ncbi:MAG: putative RNase H-like nuclease (RuvC/YqgF family) [Planctomycetota bacterium]|jgi:predicted RNase H-like nuclease (RuvC/YqgF family)
MSNPLPLVLIASLVAGGAGAAATTMLSSKPAATSTTSGITQDNTDILAKLDSMEQSYYSMADRLEALERNSELVPVGNGAERISAVAPEIVLEDAVRNVLASMDDSETVAATPKLEQAVAAVIEMREERSKLERDQKRAEAEEKRLEDRLAKLQTDLGLDQNQLNSMRTIYQDQDQQRTEFRDKMRDGSGGSREEIRTLWTDMRDSANTAIEGVLTPSQYETYQESNQNDRGFGRGGGGGNTGGGGRGGR